MKQFLAAMALLVFFAFPAFAFSITAPAKAVSSSNWSFGVEFELADSFQLATVSLDGKKILTMSSNFRTFEDPFNGEKIIRATGFAAERKLFVSMAGLDTGEHTLTVETQNDSGVVLDTKTHTIAAIDALPAGYKDEVQTQLDALKNQNDSLQQQLDALQQANSSLEEKTVQQQQTIEQQRTELGTLTTLANWLQENQNSTTQFNESVAQQMQGIETKLSSREQALQSIAGDGSVTGLASQPGQFGWRLSTILGLLILVAIAGYAILQHVRERKLY